MPEAKHKVLVTRDVGEDAMAIIRGHKELEIVLWPEDRAAPREWVLKNLEGASGALVMIIDRVDEEFVKAAGTGLKVVSTMSVGYEHVSLDYLASKKIRLGFTPDVLTEAVADVSVMLALMASRNVGESIQIVNSGKWPTMPWSPFLLTGPQLSHVNPSKQRTIIAGFLGFGRIAQATLHRMIAFGVTDVIFATSSSDSPTSSSADYSYLLKRHGPQLQSIRKAPVAEVAQNSDVVFVLTPGGAKTHHLVNEAFLRKMKPDAILVNASRGTVVDSDALAKALREKWIWGAGLDVVEGEPRVGLDHPLVKEPRCVILPHIGSATLHTRTAMATRAASNLVAGVLGEEMDAEVQQEHQPRSAL